MIGKTITLDNEDKYLVILENNVDNKYFLIGVKVVLDKYTNEFKLFLEKKKDEDILLEEIHDEELLRTLVNSYILDNLN